MKIGLKEAIVRVFDGGVCAALNSGGPSRSMVEFVLLQEVLRGVRGICAASCVAFVLLRTNGGGRSSLVLSACGWILYSTIVASNA
jgi:hypothetical protein